MTNTFTFNSRESYLTFRAEWRASYKLQSEEIRQIKRDIKAAYDAGDEDRASALQYKLHLARHHANLMMVRLAEAKEFKNAQLATRQQAA